MSTTKWVLDPSHSELLFKVKHLMIANVKGEFRKFDVIVEGDDFAKSKVEVRIDAASVYTNEENRDKHLKSPDFFDVENHKELIFKSREITKTGDNNYKMTGDLTIKGISKEVLVDAEFEGTNKDPWGNEKAAFSISSRINRKDWDLNWNAVLETGGMLVSDEVRIEGDLQFIKQQ